MVRKIIGLLAILCVIVCVSTPHALAYSVYDEGNISTTLLTYYKDMSNQIGIDEDYVLARTGNYEYIMAVGKLKFENDKFSSDNARIYKITTNTGYNSNYVFSVSNDTQFNLTVGDSIIYSNLGSYPDIIEKGVVYDYIQTFTIIIIGLCLLIRPIFKFVLRSRG